MGNVASSSLLVPLHILCQVLTFLLRIALASATTTFNPTTLKQTNSGLEQAFDHLMMGKETGERSLDLKKDKQSAADFALMFYTLAAGSG